MRSIIALLLAKWHIDAIAIIFVVSLLSYNIILSLVIVSIYIIILIIRYITEHPKTIELAVEDYVQVQSLIDAKKYKEALLFGYAKAYKVTTTYALHVFERNPLEFSKRIEKIKILSPDLKTINLLKKPL